MSEVLICRAMPIADLALGGDGRTVVVKLLSYNRDYTVSDDGVNHYTERWRGGSFKRSLAHNGGVGLPLTYEHTMPGQPRALPVGGSRRAWEDADSLMLEGRISRTSTGDDLVELLRDEVVRGVSLEAAVFRSAPFMGGHERLEARLKGVAFTTAAQYDDAALVALRSEPDVPVTPRLDAVRARSSIFSRPS